MFEMQRIHARLNVMFVPQCKNPTPKLLSCSSAVKTARKCLRTHDLVVSHLWYDDVNENEASIENALDLLWNRLKPSGVMIILLEGTYRYKKLGYGLSLLSVKGCKS